jgi:hypothetical protein
LCVTLKVSMVFHRKLCLFLCSNVWKKWRNLCTKVFLYRLTLSTLSEHFFSSLYSSKHCLHFILCDSSLLFGSESLKLQKKSSRKRQKFIKTFFYWKKKVESEKAKAPLSWNQIKKNAVRVESFILFYWFSC